MTLRSAVTVAAVLIPLQIAVGDLHGLNTREYQPAKIAAIEAAWQTQRGAPLVLFGVPDEKTKQTRFAIEIPKLASLIVTHSLDGEIKGLDAFEGKHPPVAAVFYSFRVMVGMGLLMLATSWLALWQLRRTAHPTPLVARTLLVMTFAGWVALVAGWYTTEVGRQPWLVYGLLPTAQAAGAVPASMIGLSLVIYLTLYLLLTAAYVAVVFRLARNAAPASTTLAGERVECPAGPPRLVPS